MIETTLPAMLAMDQISMAGSLVIAAILGSLLGIERSIAGKRAGMRTYALVSLGSCLFVLLGTIASSALLSVFPGVNPLQIAGSVVIGIGFIGSGLVALNGDKHVELTTASGIWVVAGIGMACGFGLYLLAGVTTVLAATILSLVLRVENAARKRLGTTTE
ncbi:MAG: MgtC/SapB family protein [Patescibacteria group bacterium]